MYYPYSFNYKYLMKNKPIPDYTSISIANTKDMYSNKSSTIMLDWYWRRSCSENIVNTMWGNTFTIGS